VLVAVLVEVLVVGVMEVMIVGCFDWRSEAFLGSFSVYGDNLENLFNPKYRFTAFNV
jgi:hypothetical protein